MTFGKHPSVSNSFPVFKYHCWSASKSQKPSVYHSVSMSETSPCLVTWEQASIPDWWSQYAPRSCCLTILCKWSSCDHVEPTHTLGVSLGSLHLTGGIYTTAGRLPVSHRKFHHQNQVSYAPFHVPLCLQDVWISLLLRQQNVEAAFHPRFSMGQYTDHCVSWRCRSIKLLGHHSTENRAMLHLGKGPWSCEHEWSWSIRRIQKNLGNRHHLFTDSY